MYDYLVIDGINTYEDLGLLLANEGADPADLQPPEVRETLVDIPGGGFLDLSEAYGSVAFGQREQSFEFVLASHDGVAIEQEISTLLGLFHGQRCKFSLSWDADYTYTGRWNVESYENHGSFGTIALHVIAEPYKSAGIVTYTLLGGEGIGLVIQNGHKRVRPTIIVENTSKVAYGGQEWTLDAGTWTIDELLLEPGESELVINTSPELGASLVGDYASSLVSALANKRIYELTNPDTSSGGNAYVSFERFYL